MNVNNMERITIRVGPRSADASPSKCVNGTNFPGQKPKQFLKKKDDIVFRNH